MKKIRILSVDGGGIRGVLPGTILAQLEKILQKRSKSERKLGDYFDMIAGTSTGGQPTLPTAGTGGSLDVGGGGTGVVSGPTPKHESSCAFGAASGRGAP